MRAGQGEASEPGVIKLRTQPAVHSVALLAISGVADLGMAWIVRVRIVRRVA